MFRSVISCVGIYQPFHVVSTILYCASHFSYFVSHSMFRAAILYHVSHFHVVSAISCFASHSMLCQSFYFSVRYFIYTISHSLVTFLLLCVLQVYYLYNLLSNVPIPTATPCCQFFISDVIDKISILDREVSRDGSVTFGKLPISKTCFVSAFGHYCHFIVMAV
jgi:hypothetical protein